ncbi:adhesion G-protein coupled receptor G5-like isoform 2-T2 [Spinachia spinachia]
MSRMTWVLFVGLLWIYPVLGAVDKVRKCLTPNTAHAVVADRFNGFIHAKNHWPRRTGCILFVQKNQSKPNTFGKEFPEMRDNNGSSELHFPRFYLKRKLQMVVMEEEPYNICNITEFFVLNTTSCISYNATGPCQITCLHPKTECEQSIYNETQCNLLGLNKYRMTIRNRTCLNCDNPVKSPESNFTLNTTFTPKEGEKLDAAEAAGVVKGMADLAAVIESSAALNVGEGVTGIFMKQTDSAVVNEMLFGYTSPSGDISILEETNIRPQFSRSVRLSKEAFEKAISLNISVPFGAMLRFFNLDTDEANSIILGNEVLAVEMGEKITNLTDKISIGFKNMEYEGIPSCRSWNGDGSRPNWTEDGCLTIQNGNDITCECSHLTFFAILLVPLNDSISSSDLNNLTVITQVGCGVSMFFLSIVLFMHFLLRRIHASTSTMILIHLVSATFLLNFTFLINNFVASLKSSVACKILAALTHYFMLATFTWFAAQAFHLCMLLYTRRPIGNRRYLLKVSIISWVQPSAIVTLMLILGKYGERAINTSDPEDHVAICWITDNNAHYIVNIGYYVLVFIFTFTTFIITVSYLFCLKRNTNISVCTESSTNNRSITTILGLCCMTGITWGFAFFAYGPLRIPAYYIFTVSNSFQGFFLFIYYRYTSAPIEVTKDQDSSVNHSALQTSTSSVNPYIDLTGEEPGGETGTDGGGLSAGSKRLQAGRTN